MSRIVLFSWLLLILVCGCAENSLLTTRPKNSIPQQHQQDIFVSRQNQELQTRANQLDQANQGLGTELAHSKKKTRILQDEIGMLKERLRDATSKLTRVLEDKRVTDQKVQALTASVREQSSGSIRPNNSLLKSLPQIANQAVDIRRKGDLIRVAIPCNQLFENGSARMRQTAYPMLTEVAEELLRIYPRNMIGIEGHTENGAVYSTQWRSNTKLSFSQAVTIYDVLLTQTRFQPNQLFVVGHGGNHPTVSNATPAGKQANQRIELVIYPNLTR